MIQARCLQRSCHPLKNGHRHLSPFSPSTRHYSSSRPRVAATSLTQSRTPFTPQPWSPSSFNGGSTTRFASTASSATPIANVQTDFTPPSTTPIIPDEQLLSTSLDDITSSIPAPAYDHIGFLKEMGLDFGWGTTAMMETILEHVHIYANTPWWASIGLTLVLVRLAMLKIYIDAADTTAKNQLIEQYNKPIMDRLKAAQLNRDMPAVSAAMGEIRQLRASAGVKYYKLFLPFISIPIGFSTFRLVRGMSYLPVPGLDTGGLLWMKDLTLSDPYFVLPCATAAAYYFSFKAGGEQGSTAVMNPTVKKIFLYVLPPFSGFIMCLWPGALQLTFFIQATITLIQSTALRQNWVRDFLGIQPLPDRSNTQSSAQAYTGTINRYQPPSSTPEKKKGIIGGGIDDVRSAMSTMKKSLGKMASEQKKKTVSAKRRTDAELRHAKAYDERRKREMAQERFEREQEAEARKVEGEEKRKGKMRQ